MIEIVVCGSLYKYALLMSWVGLNYIFIEIITR